MKLRHTTAFLALLLGALIPCGFGFAPGTFDEFEEPELTLRLDDVVQESRTTSVNWPAGKLSEAGGKGPKTKTPRAFKILVDPGHGGKDLGAVGYWGTLEKELCLKIGRQVQQQLERQGKLQDIPIEVRMSRDSDTYLTLTERVKNANDWNADVFVSVHANSSPQHRSARGYEVYFMNPEASDSRARAVASLENGEQVPIKARSAVLSILSDVQANYHINESSRFAETVYRSLSHHFRSNGRGVRQAPFTVLSGTQMPSILVEVGYVTHPEEVMLLRKSLYLKKLASAISSGIVEYLLTTRKMG